MDLLGQIAAALAVTAVVALASKILETRRHRQTIRVLRRIRTALDDHVELNERRHRKLTKRVARVETHLSLPSAAGSTA